MILGKTKRYYRKKNKENYELKKQLSKEYKADFGANSGKSFSQFVKERKKHLGK